MSVRLASCQESLNDGWFGFMFTNCVVGYLACQRKSGTAKGLACFIDSFCAGLMRCWIDAVLDGWVADWFFRVLAVPLGRNGESCQDGRSC